MDEKHASSQAAWALLTQGVTSARLNAHRLQHMVGRVSRLVDESDHKDHLHQMAGDVILAAPSTLNDLIRDLDRTGLVLSKMGEKFLSARLPLTDKAMVEDAVMPAFGGGNHRHGDPTAERLAARWLSRRAQRE